MNVVVLGTGATIGTFANEQLGVNGFTARLDHVYPSWRHDYSHLNQAVLKCGSSNLDRIWTHIDLFAKFPQALGPNPYGPDISGQLRKALLRAYSLNDEVNELVNGPKIHGDFKLKHVLRGLRPGDAIVSFNWDTAAERIAEKLDVRLVVAAGPHVDPDRVNLIKPHGSLSWEDQGEHRPILWRDQDSSKPRVKPMEVERVHNGEYLQPLVLGAVPIKDELIKETQPNKELAAVILGQLSAMFDAVSRATEITVVGYTFPPEDAYARALLWEASRRRALDRPLKIAYHRRSNGKGVEDTLKQVFGDTVICSHEGAVSPPK